MRWKTSQKGKKGPRGPFYKKNGAPTFFAPGSKISSCNLVFYILQQEIPDKGHNFSTQTNVLIKSC